MEEVLLPLHSKFDELRQRLGGDKDQEVKMEKKEGLIRRSRGTARCPHHTVKDRL